MEEDLEYNLNDYSIEENILLKLSNLYNQNSKESAKILHRSTFRNTISFNQPLNNWNTISATSMNNMFNNAQNFNQDISNLNVINVSNYDGFRTNCPLTDQNIPSKYIVIKFVIRK